MPIHDWKKPRAGLFHDFHLEWIHAIKHSLNNGVLPRDYFAIVEQKTDNERIPDVLALERKTRRTPDASGGDSGPPVATLQKPAMERTASGRLEWTAYRQLQRTLAIRHSKRNRLIAVIEIVSRGNKSSESALDEFVEKIADFIGMGIHVMLIDVQPPTVRDPDGIHGVIWERLCDLPYHNETGKPLTFASYDAEEELGAYVLHASVGDPCPILPLFLAPGGECVNVPLEESYLAAWNSEPEEFRDDVLNPESGRDK